MMPLADYMAGRFSSFPDFLLSPAIAFRRCQATPLYIEVAMLTPDKPFLSMLPSLAAASPAEGFFLRQSRC